MNLSIRAKIMLKVKLRTVSTRSR